MQTTRLNESVEVRIPR